MAAMNQGSPHCVIAMTCSRGVIAALCCCITTALFTLSPLPSCAQQQPAPSSQQPAYTLHSSTRIVLTDVTVKDRAGHIIHGLPASAFHVFDNNQPQTISTFEEHNNAPTAIAAQPVSTPNTYSNEFLRHLPPVLNIVVLDTTSLGLTQQMYLAYEFNNFLKTLPPDLPLALYARVGETPVLVQDFTSDHALLLAASAKVMPHLPPPGRDPSTSQTTISSSRSPLSSPSSPATKTSSGSPVANPASASIPAPTAIPPCSSPSTTSSNSPASPSIPSTPAAS